MQRDRRYFNRATRAVQLAACAVLVDLVARASWAVAHEATGVGQIEVVQRRLATLMIGTEAAVDVVAGKVAIVIACSQLSILHRHGVAAVAQVGRERRVEDVQVAEVGLGGHRRHEPIGTSTDACAYSRAAPLMADASNKRRVRINHKIVL